MSAPQPRRAEVLFYQALELPPADRTAFLNEQCGAEPGLLEEVEELLQAHEEAGGFLPANLSAAEELDSAPEPSRLKPEAAGDRIGPYKLLEQIGEGGFGTVWVAEQEQPIRRRVALKIIKLGMDTKDVVARFEQERQALAMMDHPNIAKVLDAGATPFGRPFFVMELVHGVKITDYCDQANLPTAERLRLFIAVCQAVQHAHQKGIIHRDLKPSNILVTLHDGVPVPKVIDFGVAKAIQQRLTDLTIYTQFEQMIGTPLYMSPEQAEFSGIDIDTRSDIYSLGVLLYELLTGRTPFDPEALRKAGYDEIRRVIREEEPPKPSTVVSTLAINARTTLAQLRQTDGAKLIGQIRGDLDWIVMKALEKDRNRRYETANGFAHDIERHLQSEPVLARPPSPGYRFRRFAKRNKVAFAATTAVLAALIVGLGASTWMFFKEKQARERAVAAERAQQEARKTAESEASKSRQVAQFLTDMLEGVAPSVALGRDTKMLREILDKTAERIGADLKGQPEVESDLRSVIGNVYSQLGDLGNAATMHRAALATRQTLYGNEHAAVADSLYHLANSSETTAEAERLHREALGMRTRLLGNEHIDVARSMTAIALILRSSSRFEEAEAMSRESLAMLRKLAGNDNSLVAHALLALAQAVGHQKRFGESGDLHREGLQVLRKLHGNKHPAVATTLLNLAQNLYAEGKLDEAEALTRESLAMRSELFGDAHFLLIEPYEGLVSLLWEQQKFAEGESVLRKKLAIERQQFGDECIGAAVTLDNLARVLSEQGKHDEAETTAREGLTMARKLWGNENLNVVSQMYSLAGVLRKKGNLVEAETLLHEALAIRKNLFGGESPEIPDLLHELGHLIEEKGDLAEAETMLRESLSLQRKQATESDPKVATFFNCLVRVLESAGKVAEIEATHREAVAYFRGSAIRDPEALELGLTRLAENFFRQGRYAEAEPLYREVIQSRQARLPGENSKGTESMASLARLLADWAWSERSSLSNIGNLSPHITERACTAERLLRDYLEIKRIGAATHWRATGEGPSRLGGALLAVAVTDPSLTGAARLAKFSEAETLLLEGHVGLQQGAKVESKYKGDSFTRLIRLYEAWNKPQKAAEWRQKLDEFKKSEPKLQVAGKDASPKP